MQVERAPCGKCCICFKPICNENPNDDLCYDCLPKLTEKDDQGFFIHPTRRTRILTCVCGKPMTESCKRDALFSKFGTVYTVDTSLMMQAKTGKERRAMVENGSALILMRRCQHGVKN